MVKKVLKIRFIPVCIGLIMLLFCASAAGKDFVVVIDPGHGGHDPGAVGKISKEKNINLNVALQLGKMIEKNCKDVKVIYTRKTDVFVALDKRANIANNAKADLFISIHTNALAKGKIVRGAETFTLGLARSEANLEIAKRENSVILIEDDYKQRYADFNPNSSESYIMFEFIQDKHMEQSVKLAKLVQHHFRTHAQRIDRGVHQAGFLVLRATTMPSVLIELGYISTPDEEKFLNTQAGTEKLATGIYKAFLSYKEEHQKPLNGDNRLAGAQPQPSYEEPDTDKASTTPTTSAKAQKSPEKPKPDVRISTAAADNGKPVFKIQILSSTKALNKNDRQFKGLTPIDSYKEKGLYKYTYTESTDYNKVLRAKNSITSKFKDAFIIAFKNGEKMNVQEAIAEFKRNKK